jgi:lysine-N-methylase
MSLPVRHLPVLQKWDCQSCSRCCREYQIPVTEEERRRLQALDWADDAVVGDHPLFKRVGPWWARRYVLNHTDDHCVFLTPKGRCRIHERFGMEAKPLACRLYPFLLLPAGDHWRVGLRYACPAAAANQGKPLKDHGEELHHFAAELEKDRGWEGAAGSRDATKLPPPPPLQGGQRVDWPDLVRFVQAVLALLRDRQVPLGCRLRRCLALAKLCRQARFDQVTGERLKEFLQVISASLVSEVPVEPAFLPAPTWLGNVLFRQALALYVRKDQGPERGPATRSRLALLRAVVGFVRGRGEVPQLHGRLPQTTFEALEQPAGSLPDAAEEILERYYAVKVGSLQFCGRSNFGLSLWDGLASLALTYPVIRWLGRAFSDLPPEKAIERALSIVDYNVGFNPLLGARRQRFSLRILVNQGELEKLIAWYSR